MFPSKNCKPELVGYTRKREKIIKKIKKLQLDKKFENIILELIDISEINADLRKTINDMLNLHVDIIGKKTEILIYQTELKRGRKGEIRGKNFERVNKEINERVEQLKQMKKQLPDKINKMMMNLKVRADKTQKE